MNTLVHDYDNHDYDDLVKALQENFKIFFDTVSNGALFTTNASGLYEAYLANLPRDHQYHNCHTCRRFIENFGHIATISEQGDVIPMIWSGVAGIPAFYSVSANQICELVKKSEITGVFYSKDSVWGNAKTGDWTHFAINNPSIFFDKLKTPFQAAAEKKQDFLTVQTALGEFTRNHLEEALRILETEKLTRSEKFIAPIKFLIDLHINRSKTKNHKIRDNILWRAIATAPAGFCHPRASVIGSLLEDIIAGKSFDNIRTAFNKKLNSLDYQRPKAAPAAGNIAVAEEIVKKLGIQKSLERRYATFEEIRKIWIPVEETVKENGGFFANVKSKNPVVEQKTQINIPFLTMTWDKFSRTILPTAEAMEINIKSTPLPFLSYVTATHADAPPILKWDCDEERNPVSWYVKAHSEYPQSWCLALGWHKVTGVASLPTMWGSQPQSYLHEGYVILVKGAKDKIPSNVCLFPEIMKNDLHQIRSVLEAYSRTEKLSGHDVSSASGWDVRKGMEKINCELKVYKDGKYNYYKIDRWD